MTKKPQKVVRPRKVPRQSRAVVTVDALIEAAARVLEREGVGKLTTNRVAEVAGVSIGTLYQYFPSKDALVAALSERFIEQYFSAFQLLMQGAREAPFELAIQGILRGILAVFRSQPKVHAELYGQMPALGVDALLQRMLRRYVAEIQALLEARRGELAASITDTYVAAYVVLHSIEGIARSFATDPSAVADGESHLGELGRMLLGYLTGRAA